jgi:hypothetical protein
LSGHVAPVEKSNSARLPAGACWSWGEAERESRFFSHERSFNILRIGCRYLFWVLVLAVFLGGLGCQKLKSAFRKPAAPGVLHQSYPISAYAYQVSLAVKTSPHELMNYFAQDPKDLSWLRESSGAYQLELKTYQPHTDMTQPGQFLDFSFKVLGIAFPCRLICLKSKPDQELWWMMVLTGDSWILVHFEMKQVSEGCKLHLSVLGQPPKYLQAIVNIRQLLEAVAARADLALTWVQADFDPTLDVEQLTGHGLRGELYETFLQGNESSIRVNAPPSKVVRWIFSNPENLNFLIPNLRLKGPCFDDPQILFAHPEELVACPSTYQVSVVEMKAIVLSQGRWEDENKMTSYHHNVWIAALDHLIRVQILVTQQGAGSELKIFFASDLSESAAAEAVDFIIAIAGITERCEQALLKIKAGVEGPGV